MDLKEFLESERAKMKARSEQVPTPYLSDPLDIVNIKKKKDKLAEEENKKRLAEKERIRIEKERQEEEERIRQEELTKKQEQAEQEARLKKMKKAKGKAKPIPEPPPPPPEPVVEPEPILEGEALLKANLSFDEDDQQKKMGTESCQTIISHFPGPEGPTENLANRLKDLKTSLTSDVKSGYLNPKETYNPYFYVDPKINRLQAAKNMIELFRIAEEIIMGDAFVEVEENMEEEFVEIEEGEKE